MRIRWLAAAAADLESVFAYIAQDNREAAGVEVERVLEAIGRLGMHPALGRAGRVAGTRELVVSPYVVAYRIKAGNVQVLRVLHGSRNWPELLKLGGRRIHR